MQLMGDQDFSEDEGMPSLAEMEAGFLGRDLFAARSSKRKTKKMTKTTATEGREQGMEMAFPLPHPPLSRSGLFYGDCSEQPRHFLDACFLCKKPLLQNRDIFMYRGDIPFCSEECRQEQMDKEEATERNRILSLRDASSSSSSSSSSNSDATRDPLQQQDPIPPTTTNRSRFHDFLRRAAGSILAG